MLRQLMITLALASMLLAACVPNGPGVSLPGTDVSLPGTGGETEPVVSEPTQGSPDDPVSSPTDGVGTEEPAVVDWQPQPGDEALSRGEVFLDSSDILVLESYPPQFVLALRGSLPTPCHQLRVVVSEPNSEDQILVEVYTLVDPAAICIQMLKEFEVNIPLGSYSEGKLDVVINGEVAGVIEP